MREYEPGLHEVADGCHAYLQPGGGWGWSNAGLVVGDGGSLLVDTLFDLDLTARMLEAMAPAVLTAPIGTVVNTHANGDHCYGNQLLGDREIVASSAAAEEMGEVPPALLAGLVAAEGEVGDLFRSFFGEFRFEGIELTLPTRTFDGRLELDVGGRAVELIEVGPAHTRGDVLAHVPDARTIFTGDILFIGGTPIVWAGPLANWVAACDLILGLDVEQVVPGHGPVTDKTGVVEVRDYLTFIDREATARFEAGLDAVGGGEGHRPRDRRGRLRRPGGAGSRQRQRRDRLPDARPEPSAREHRRAVPAHGRARRRVRASSSGLDAEVAVVGSGPAGWAAAAVLAEVGVQTVLVAPAPGQVWPATYGCWVDELEPIGLRSIVRTSWPSVRVVGHREHEVPRAYVVLDNARLHAVLSEAFGRAGGRTVVGGAVGAQHFGWGSRLLLAEDRPIEVRLIVDATGGGRHGLLRRAGPPRATRRRSASLPASTAHPSPPGRAR